MHAHRCCGFSRHVLSIVSYFWTSFFHKFQADVHVHVHVRVRVLACLCVRAHQTYTFVWMWQLGKPSFNGFWAQQEVTGFDPHSAANGLMFNTLFGHKKVVLGENNNMEWCMQDKEGKGCQKQGLTFDRSTGAFNPKTGMYTVRMRTTELSLF